MFISIIIRTQLINQISITKLTNIKLQCSTWSSDYNSSSQTVPFRTGKHVAQIGKLFHHGNGNVQTIEGHPKTLT